MLRIEPAVPVPGWLEKTNALAVAAPTATVVEVVFVKLAASTCTDNGKLFDLKTGAVR